MGMSYFLVQKCTHATTVSCFSVHLPFVPVPFAKLCQAFGGFGSLLEALGWFERFWKVLQALQGVVRLCAVLRGVERLWEVL